MEYMQFTAVVLMTLLTLKLMLLPGKVSVNPAANKSRWMMVAGTIVLVFQFLLQLIFGLRAMGVTQAAMLNLALFISRCRLFTCSAGALLPGSISIWEHCAGACRSRC